jgi:hypothetical protein
MPCKTTVYEIRNTLAKSYFWLPDFNFYVCLMEGNFACCQVGEFVSLLGNRRLPWHPPPPLELFPASSEAKPGTPRQVIDH